jgi:hypothetical protein
MQSLRYFALASVCAALSAQQPLMQAPPGGQTIGSQNPGTVGSNGAPIPPPARAGSNPDPNINLSAGRLSRGGNRPPRGVPRHADGRIALGPALGEKGAWEGNAGATLATNPKGGLDNPSMYLPTNIKLADVPFQPWARAVYQYRQSTTTKDDPHVRCKASGGPRMFHTPYGFEMLEHPELERIIIAGVGGPHSWRVVYLDGREHPKDLDPSFSGHSIGKWDGDTLVVDTVGFNEKFWLTREGIPHTSKLHLTEKFTRTDYYTLRYEATIEDPGAYTAPWSGGWIIRWIDAEMYEYVCQDNNRDVKHMFGGPRE